MNYAKITEYLKINKALQDAGCGSKYTLGHPYERVCRGNHVPERIPDGVRRCQIHEVETLLRTHPDKTWREIQRMVSPENRPHAPQTASKGAELS